MAYTLQNIDNSDCNNNADKDLLCYWNNYFYFSSGSSIYRVAFTDDTYGNYDDSVPEAVGTIVNLFSDGNRLHSGNASDKKLRAYDADLTLKHTSADLQDEPHGQGCYDGSYLYIPLDNQIIQAVSYDTVTGYTIGGFLDLGAHNGIERIVCDANYQYSIGSGSGADLLCATSYDGASFTKLDGESVAANVGEALCLHKPGATQYIICNYSNDQLIAYTFNGSSFTKVRDTTQDSIGDLGTQCYWLESDNTYIYAMGYEGTSQDTYIYALTFDGSNFVLVSSAKTSEANVPNTMALVNNYLHQTGDDNNLYAVKMGLTAQISADPLTGIAPLTVTFSAS